MSRRLHILTATAVALGLMVEPSLAQTKPGMNAPTPAPQAAQTASPAATPAPTPGSEEWLRQRGESYHSAPESAQNPNEVEATVKLNARIADRNAAAESLESEQRAEYQRAQAAYEADLAEAERARRQWEADTAAAQAAAAEAQARYERQQAAYEAAVQVCERAGGRNCRSAPRN